MSNPFNVIVEEEKGRFTGTIYDAGGKVFATTRSYSRRSDLYKGLQRFFGTERRILLNANGIKAELVEGKWVRR